MVSINYYLNFPGTTEEAFNFYKSIFGGEFAFVQRYKDTPDGDKLTPEQQNMIMHMALPIGKNILMGTDAIREMGHPLTIGNNTHLTVNADTREDADKLFNSLSAGGTATLPIQDMFWGAYFGMLIDKFGIQWMVSYDPNFGASILS